MISNTQVLREMQAQQQLAYELCRVNHHIGHKIKLYAC